jgi:hypothetical protein
MAEYTHYDPATGRVMQGGTCPDDDLFMQHRAGCARLDGVAGAGADDWVDLSGGAPVLRVRPWLNWPATLTLTQGDTQALVLPYAGTITVGDTALSVSAGQQLLQAAWPGTYEIVVDAFPARPHRMRVEVAGSGDPPAPEAGAIILHKTRDEIAALRQRRYLAAWPLPQQAEAHADASGGNSAKLDQMLVDFAGIKASLPYPPEVPA